MTDKAPRWFPPPWTFEQIPGGYKVLDASGESLPYVYGRQTRADADIAHVLTRGAAKRDPILLSALAPLPISELKRFS
jgi:hypothetical protein